MKIGILTFHWAANHGAVLQTYATQTYLKDRFDADIKVINYCPKNHEISFFRVFRSRSFNGISTKFKAWKKDKAIAGFREKLNLTQRYYSNAQLIATPPNVDLLFCGSDQIWNPYYLLYGEGKVTPVYFLNFGSNCKKAGLSVSFGCTEYPTNAEDIVKPYIKAFDKISVREKSGIDILKNMGIDGAVVTADPTSLLSREQYLSLCQSCSVSKEKFAAACILRNRSYDIKKIANDISSDANLNILDIEKMSMEGWLSGIRDAKFVVTNSFHCVMLCLKLHTPFVVIAETGQHAGMNDRLFTLLEYFGLSDRIILDYNACDLSGVKEIDWGKVDLLMDEYSNSLKNYIDCVVGGKDE